ncbi:MAG: FMN-binding protein [Phycisphaerae bacterium]|nr:FMN-binding protein [Phycisphaerae bacterium]
MFDTQRYAALLSLAMLSLILLPLGCRSVDITPAQSARRQFGDAVRLGAVYQAPGRSGRIESVQPAVGPSGVEGYVATVWCKSKSNLFPVRVVMDRGFGVLSATVLSYPSRRGREVQSPRFTKQFRGKGPGDPVKVGKDIDAVSGATSSSSAMADGVRRAIQTARRSLTVNRTDPTY